MIKKNEKRFNKGNELGRALIRRSLEKLGCGRSVLADKNGVIIAGNDVYEQAVSLGKGIVVIETTGDTLVVVKRMDVSASDCKGMELSLIDNLSQEKGLVWDADELQSAMDNDMSFDPRKWGGDSAMVKELDLTSLLRDDVVAKEKTKKQEDLLRHDSQLSLFDY